MQLKTYGRKIILSHDILARAFEWSTDARGVPTIVFAFLGVSTRFYTRQIYMRE